MELNPLERAVADGDYKKALDLLIGSATRRAERLHQKGGHWETIAASASMISLDRLHATCNAPLSDVNAAYKLIFLAVEFGYFQRAAREADAGHLQMLERSLAKSEGAAETAKDTNRKRKAWRLHAFAARAVILHHNRKAPRSEINGKVFRYVHDLGFKYDRDTFASALRRNAGEVQEAQRVVAEVAAGRTVEDVHLQKACADALKHFRPK